MEAGGQAHEAALSSTADAPPIFHISDIRLAVPNTDTDTLRRSQSLAVPSNRFQQRCARAVPLRFLCDNAALFDSRTQA